MSFQVRQGLVMGRNHIIDNKNCQDALCHLSFECDGKRYIIGAVADGCGEGKHSELGAQLAVQFIQYESRAILQQGVLLEEIPARLFDKLLLFLENFLAGYNFSDLSERITFIQHHLLFTLIGFIITPERTLVFAYGDGIVLIDECIYLRDQDNMSAYIGYHLLDSPYFQTNSNALSGTFDVYSVPTSTLTRLAIGSDAWLQEQSLLGQIWQVKTSIGLQLQMNRWSNTRHLKDDASLIVVEREA
jgi:hypothetical protein